ncbi:MAG: DUF3307 domain-containing protein [Candidatus Korobacteraceae bacterium]
MQPIGNTFLALILAHLCGDFPLQTDALVRAKKNGFRGFAIHAAVHYLCAIAALLTFTHDPVWGIYPQSLLILYVALHVLLDYLKVRYLKIRGQSDSTGPFVVDQALHLIMVIALSLALLHIWPPQLALAGVWTEQRRHTMLLLAVTYVAVIFAGGYLVRSLTRSLTVQMEPPEGESPKALRDAGLYIGWLERFLVLTALLVQSPAMIGLILTGKSIARLSELKGPQFAEYFLIGTLLSVSLAVSGGVLLQLMLYGTIFAK